MSELIPNTDGSSEKRQSFPGVPPMIINPAKTYEATMVTDRGTLEILLDPLAAPVTVNNFVFLARWHYFDGIIFHRVIPGFVLQGGDPTGTGTGGSDLPDLPAEFSSPQKARFQRGTLGAARTNNPDSANSQFFIMFAPTPSLDGQYTIWGQVTSGMEFVDRIKRGVGGGGTVPAPADRLIRMRVLADT